MVLVQDKQEDIGITTNDHQFSNLTIILVMYLISHKKTYEIKVSKVQNIVTKMC